MDHTPYVMCGLHQIVGDEIRLYASRFVFPPVTGADQNRTRSAVFSQVDIAWLIANHERAPQVEPEIGGGLAGEQRLRLAASAMIFGNVRAVIKRIDVNATRGQPFPQLGMNAG